MFEHAETTDNFESAAPFIAPSVMSTQTFDVVLAPAADAIAAHVVITTIGQASADAIVSALRAASLYQCEGLTPFARAVDR